MTRALKLGIVALGSLALVGFGSNALAQAIPVGVGLQGDWGSDNADFGVGGRVIVGLEKYVKNLEAVGSFDYFFPSVGEDFAGREADPSYWEVNANGVYKLTIQGSSIRPYAGAGINIAHSSGGFGSDLGEFGSLDVASDSSTKVGLNVLGGALFGRGKTKFFAEMKFEARSHGIFVFSAGLRI